MRHTHTLTHTHPTHTHKHMHSQYLHTHTHVPWPLGPFGQSSLRLLPCETNPHSQAKSTHHQQQQHHHQQHVATATTTTSSSRDSSNTATTNAAICHQKAFNGRRGLWTAVLVATVSTATTKTTTATESNWVQCCNSPTVLQSFVALSLSTVWTRGLWPVSAMAKLVLAFAFESLCLAAFPCPALPHAASLTQPALPSPVRSTLPLWWAFDSYRGWIFRHYCNNFDQWPYLVRCPPNEPTIPNAQYPIPNPRYQYQYQYQFESKQTQNKPPPLQAQPDHVGPLSDPKP